MSHVPATPPVIPPGAISHIYNVRDYRAAGDGETDDTTAINSAIDAARTNGGGTVYFSPGTYKTTTTLLMNTSNVTLLGVDAEMLFQPTAPIVGGTNDRAIYIHAGDSGGYSSVRNITGALAVGATSFIAASAGDVTDLVAGDWLTIQETDGGSTPNGEIVLFDWAQVQSVVGSTVNLMAPLRTAFPGTHSTIGFRRIINVVEGVTIKDLRIRTTDEVNALPHVAIGLSRDVLVDNVTSESSCGNCFYSYRAANVTLRSCKQRANFVQASEFAATAGLSIVDCTFGTYNSAATSAQLVLDYGTAFFNVSGNHIGPAGNIGCMILYGCHDGVFSKNVIDYIRDEDITNTVGLLVTGCERVIVANNNLRGGDGASGTGIAVTTASTGFTAPLTSLNNQIVDNIVQGFAVPYGTAEATDLYRYPAGATTTMRGPLSCLDTLSVDGSVTLGNASTDEHLILGSVGVNASADANVGVKIAKPTGALFGLYLSSGRAFFAEYVIVPSLGVGNADIMSGTGSPEGVVSGAIGSLFLRTDGGAGTTMYVKESGAGNTGWTAK